MSPDPHGSHYDAVPPSRGARGVGRLLQAARQRLALAMLVGAISGFGITGLIAVINTALAAERSALPRLLALFVALCLLVFVARACSEALLVRISQGFIARLRGELSRQILASPLALLEQHGSHRLLAALTEDVNKVANFLTRLPTVCINAAVLLGCLVYLGWLSWPLLLVAGACIGLGVSGFAWAQGRAEGALTRSRQAGDELYKHFIAITQGAKELKLHGPRRSAFLSQWLDACIARLRRDFVAGMTVYALAESAGILTFFVCIGLLLFLPAGWVAPDRLVLTGYALTFLYLITPLEVLLGTAPAYGEFRIALRHLDELQLGMTLATTATMAAAPLTPFVRLELCGVTHQYRQERDDRPFQLGPLDLQLRAGEVVFVTGGNGSGKTTLAKLLVGLYAPESGLIRVNGTLLAAEQQESYRQLFAAVFSDFYLFEQLLGLDTPELEHKAAELLGRLQLQHKVQIVDGRYSTVALSQGQRKRLALLAAVLEDRPVCLFDEWAADQDPLFKRVFYEEILPFLKHRGKAVLVISHDDQYFHLADRALRLESGQLRDGALQAPARVAA